MNSWFEQHKIKVKIERGVIKFYTIGLIVCGFAILTSIFEFILWLFG